MKPSDYIQNELIPLQEKLNHHPIYKLLKNEKHLRFFMESHVFAVWDFMSLVKSLQLNLTGMSLPWVPSSNSETTRFINEIVLGEESDLDPKGDPKSHFELYIEAMKEMGACTDSILGFLNNLRKSEDYHNALSQSNIEPYVKHFVLDTLSLVESRKAHLIAANFAFCREDMIPEMFLEILKVLDPEKRQYEIFRYYLERHIELDGNDHGPLAMKMIDNLCSSEEETLEACEAAKLGLQSRINLWDGITQRLEHLS